MKFSQYIKETEINFETNKKDFLQFLQHFGQVYVNKYIELDNKLRTKSENEEFEIVKKELLLANNYINDFCLSFIKDDLFSLFNTSYITSIENKVIFKDDNILVDGFVVKKPKTYDIIAQMIDRNDQNFGMVFILLYQSKIIYESYLYHQFQ